MKISIISSSGGHLYKTHLLKQWWGKYQHFWVTKDDSLSRSLLKKEKKYFAHFPENRNLPNAIRNLCLAFKILLKEKPDLVFSMGAGVAPPFFLVAKILKIKTIYMENFIFIDHATLSGKICYPLADNFIVQRKKLLNKYPRAKYLGPIFDYTKEVQ